MACIKFDGSVSDSGDTRKTGEKLSESVSEKYLYELEMYALRFNCCYWNLPATIFRDV